MISAITDSSESNNKPQHTNSVVIIIMLTLMLNVCLQCSHYAQCSCHPIAIMPISIKLHNWLKL